MTARPSPRPHAAFLSLALALLAGPASAAGEAQVVVKLGTLAPSGSPWHEVLKDLARRWAEASGGRVVLKVYAGGAQGNEGEMLRKVGIGQLQAAAVTNVGLQDVAPEPKALSLPFLFADDREAACGLEAVRPDLEAALLRRGYVALQWSALGAMHLFCTSPRRTPAELLGARLFAQDGDAEANEAWREAGFRPVVLSATDLYPSLATGMVDCLPSVPIYVLTARLHERARHMLDLPWGHLYAVTLIRADAWARVPADLRPRLLDAARETGRAADAELRRLRSDALDAMRRGGLSVERGETGPWRDLMAGIHRRQRGRLVPAPTFDRVMEARAACAAAGPAAAR